MPDILQQLESCLRGRICIMGIGNVDYGDDGFGVYLAQELAGRGISDVVVAGNTPERFLSQIGEAGFDTVLLVDAVEFGGVPGSVVLLNSDEMTARFPQLSTHKISLGLLARWFETNGATKAWLLGVQPESLKISPQLTRTTQVTLDAVTELLCELLSAKQGVADGRTRRTEEVHA